MVKRVAVIAIHGVADQSSGETAQTVASQLVSARPHDAQYAYVALSESSMTLPVPPLQPSQTVQHRSTTQTATPCAEDRGLGKSFAQSWVSDLATTPSQPLDSGVELTNYLLQKHVENGAGWEAYETKAIHMRRLGESPVDVDVYEMYWADLSRLSTGAPRIIAEAFTLIFRLSKLGRDTVDRARRGYGVTWGKKNWMGTSCWALTAWLQRSLDWMLSNLLAMFILQLMLCCVLLIVLGLAWTVPDERQDMALIGIPVGIGVLGVVLFFYRVTALGRKSLDLPFVLVGMALLGCFAGARPWIGLLLVVSLISLVVNWGLKVADERFPFTRISGTVSWAVTLGLMLAYGLIQILDWPCLHDLKQQLQTTPSSPPADAFDEFVTLWMRACLFATEVWLWLTKWTWVGFGVLTGLWLLAGIGAATGQGYEARASVATGRLGLLLSVAAFLAAVMALWSAILPILNYAVCGALSCQACGGHSLPYSPVLFLKDRQGDCIHTSLAYLQDRYTESTDAFGLIVGVLGLLVVYLLLMFLPSVLAEVKVLVNKKRKASKARTSNTSAEESPEHRRHAKQLGKWLTHFFRGLDRWTFALVVLSVILSLLVASVYVWGVDYSHILQLSQATVASSQNWLGGWSNLKDLQIGAAGLIGLLIAFGGLLSKHAPMLRAPLDVALDVDNHFREFPRTQIPRARIFSRYAALLRRVKSGGYDHLVIVAHSQGSVISTELLRFFKQSGTTIPPTRLLTLGSPLRQLYAARFPSLYSWVLGQPENGGDGPARSSGPRAADIGVERWFNAFCSGDYVGRWLWSSKVDRKGESLCHPYDDGANGPGNRDEAYSPFDPEFKRADLDALTEAETCLGLGAHIHYFETEQQTVAWLVDYLVTASNQRTA